MIEKYLNELKSLQEQLEKEGQCKNSYDDCVYVKQGHSGCAVGRRLNDEEKLAWAEAEAQETDTGYYNMSRKLGVPKYFEGWHERVVEALQYVHDIYDHNRENAIEEYKRIASDALNQ